MIVPVSSCLMLAGCGTAVVPAKSAATPQAQSAAEAPAALGLSARARLLQHAVNEWRFFGRQTVVIRADRESIPHVGIWEDEDEARSERIHQYWQAAGEPGLSGSDCDQAWSAAFIVWLMRAAGVPESVFPSTISHRDYVARFLGEAPDPPFLPHTIGAYRPQPADLICAIRGNSVSLDGDELPRPADLANAKLHCDIVVESRGRSLQAIGGNVRNSVSRTDLALSPQGHLQPTPRRPWFLILENRLK
jgi:hypothetical protein